MLRSPLILIVVSFTVLKAQQPTLVLPMGHAGEITTAKFSSDDKLVITGSLDKTAMVWETFTGKKIRDLGGNKSAVRYAFFSNDSRFIAVGTDSSVNIWTVPGYKKVYSSQLAGNCSFSPDSKRLFLLDFAGTIQQVNLASLKTEFTYPDSALDNSVHLSPDNKLLCSAGPSSFTVRDISNGKIVFRKTSPGKTLKGFFTNDGNYLLLITTEGLQRFNIKKGFVALNPISIENNAVVISKNQRFLLTVKTFDLHDENAVLWDLLKYKTTFESSGILSTGDSIPVPDMNDPTIIRYKVGDLPYHFPVRLARGSVEISNEGKFIRCRDFLWNVPDSSRDGYEIPHNYLRRSDFSSDSKYLLVQQTEGVAGLLETATGKIVQTYRARAENIRSVAISEDGKNFLVSGYDSTVRIVEIATANTVRVLKGHTATVRTAVFNSDGSKILTNAYDSTAKLWNLSDGELLGNYPGQFPESNPAYFSAEDQLKLPELPIDSLAVFDLDGNLEKVIANLRYVENPENLQTRISRTGRYLLQTNPYGSMYLQDGFQENRLHFDRDFSVNAYSPDEKLLALAQVQSDSVLLIDIESNKPVFNISLHMDSAVNQSGKKILQLLFTNKYLLVTDGSAVIHALSLLNGKQLFTLPGYRCAVSANFKWLITANQGQCDVYDFEKEKLLYHYISVDPGNFLVVDPAYRFDGTDSARKMLYYVCGNEVIDLDQIKALSWEPGLVSKITRVNAELIRAKKLSDINICNYTPKAESTGFTQGIFSFQVESLTGGIGELRLYVNGKLVRRYKPGSLQKKNNRYLLSVRQDEIDSFFVSGSNNTVLLKATTEAGDLTSRGVRINNVAKKNSGAPPNLYLLSIGIGRYKDSTLFLPTPSKDAESISSVLGMSSKGLLNTDGKQHVFSWTLTTGEGNPLWPTKKRIETVLESIRQQAKADDILIIFFAGHGVAPEAAGRKTLYLPTSDLQNLDQLNKAAGEVAISFDELMNWLQRIKANKEIIILDVCNSGVAVEHLNELVKREIPSDQQRAIDNLADATGSCVLAASAAGQPAYESNVYGHGFLTYGLLSGIKLGNGLRENKYIQVNKWFDMAAEQVKQMAKGIRLRQDPKVFGNAGFDIGIVDKQVTGSLLLPMGKIFRRTTIFKEGLPPSDNVLRLSSLIDRQLKEISSRGDGSLNYAPDNEQPGTYSITGTYSIQDKTISLRVFIIKEGQGDHPVYQFDLRGVSGKQEELAGAVVQEVRRFLDQ